MPEKYSMPLTVSSFDVGADNRLKLSAVLRYQQEAAERQLAALDMGWESQLAHGMAFVTARWRGEFMRLPAMGETVTLTTWHHRCVGARFIRHYVWTDAAERIIIQGVMVFGLISLRDRRLLRADALAVLGDLPASEDTVDCAMPARFSLPPLTPVREYTVGWTDIDRNGHMNNTRYADLLCDALGDVLDTGCIAAVHMHFASETMRDERITLAMTQGKPAYVQGKTDRAVSFEAEVSFA